MTFKEIEKRLLTRLKFKIRNGELTERGFARLAGISQSHIHKVLKGEKNLSVTNIDLVLELLHWTLLDLCTCAELRGQLDRSQSREPEVFLPALLGPLGPGSPWSNAVAPERRQYLIPDCPPIQKGSLMAAKLVPDSEMHYTAQKQDVCALMLQAAEGPTENKPDSLYVVDRVQDTVIRRLRRSRNRLYLVSDVALSAPMRWQCFDRRDHERLPQIRGRVIWFGREKDRT